MEISYNDGKIELLAGINKVHILIVGAGGTGSYVIAHLGRFLYYLKKLKPSLTVFVTIADGDKFEEKNQDRQVCYSSDMNRNKARVLARKITNQFGVTCYYVDKYIEDVGTCEGLFLPECLNDNAIYTFPNSTLTILLGCVDNNGTRQIMHKAFKNFRHNLVYIDSGNGLSSGQVVLGFKQTGDVLLPPVGFYHPDMIEDKESPVPSQQSCSQRLNVTAQAMMANVWASTVVMSMVTNLLEHNTINTIVADFHAEVLNARPRVTVEKFFSNYKANIYYSLKIKGWKKTHVIYNHDLEVNQEKNLLGYKL